MLLNRILKLHGDTVLRCVFVFILRLRVRLCLLLLMIFGLLCRWDLMVRLVVLLMYVIGLVRMGMWNDLRVVMDWFVVL